MGDTEQSAPIDGEIVAEPHELSVDVTSLQTLARVEIDQQVSTAKQYPRSITTAINQIKTLATLDEDTAEKCCYALVRRSKRRGRPGDQQAQNKPIPGPSIRLAEIAAQSWGNCRIYARIIAVNRKEKYIEAEGVFHDLETNMASRATTRRRISTTDGRLFSEDMIVVTGNAACAIAKRNAILAGVPRGVYWPGYAAARAIIAGTASTLAETRAKVFKAFASYGVTPEQLFESIGVEGEADIGLEEIATLRGIYASIKNQEHTVEEIFSKDKSAPAHEIVEEPLKNKPSEHEDASSEAAAEDQADSSSHGSAGDASAAETQVPEEAPLSLLDVARQHAQEGTKAFENWFNKLKPAELDELKPQMSALSKMAKSVDAKAKQEAKERAAG